MAARPDPNALVRSAEAHFVAGRHDAALPLVEQVLRIVPGHPGVLHLHGLVLSGLDRLAPARAALEAAQRGAPTDPQIANNLGNLLGRLGEPAAALTAYDAAIRAAPGFAPARRNRAILLDELGRRDEARAALAALIAAEPPDADTRFAMAALERDAGDLAAATACLDEALAIDPGHRPARRLRLLIAADRAEPEAVARLRTAVAEAPDDGELLLVWLAAGGEDEAAARVERRLVADPGWADGHRALAAARWEAGRADHDARFAAALAERPGDATLWKAYVETLARMDAYAEAAAACLRAEAATGEPAFAAAAFAHLGAAGDAAGAEAVLARLPEGAVGPVALAKHRLRAGDAVLASRLLDRAIAADRDDIEAWALQGIAWQLAGDPRAEWLNGQPGLVGVQRLPLTDAETMEVAATLRSLHETSRIGLGQSVRGGTQTRGHLLERPEPIFRRLGQAIAAAVEAHRRAMPPHDPAHPILRRRDSPTRIAGSWSIRLTGGGFHVQHIHPKGLLSAASWWAVPPAGDGVAGRLAIGGAPAHLGLDLPPRLLVEPAVGRLALFPSTLHHGTLPFPAGERISVAFDLVAAPG